ncbi:MAG: glutathione S-transferase family protein [Thiolinea sp.]
MIKLHGFGANIGVADPSPFVLKADAYLRVAGIEFERVDRMNNLQKAPKGKLPYIEDAGEIIADSQLIIDHFEGRLGTKALDSWLNEEQQATNWLVTKAMDDHLYWCGLYSRWVRDDVWPQVRDTFFADMPGLMQKVVPGLVRRDMVKSTKAHGIGRHTDEEIQAFTRRTFNSLSVLLGDKTYFFGDRVSTLDVTAFAFLAQYILAQMDNPYNELAKSFGNLVAFTERFQAEYYPEFTV